MSKFIPLKDVAELTVGFVGTMVSHYTKDGIPFLRSLNIEPFEINTEDLKFISHEFSDKISKSILRENDVVIVRTGMPGTSCVISKEFAGCNCSDVVIVRPDLKKVNPHYLAAYINFWGQKQIQNNKVGAVQKHFNVHSAEEMLIYLPDIKTQNRIASLVVAINRKIHSNNRINENLEQQMHLIFEQMIAMSKSGKLSGQNIIAKDLTDIITGREDANFSVKNGKYKFFTCSSTPLQCNEYAFDSSSILIAGNGDFNVKHYSGKFNAYQRTYVLTPKQEYYALLYLSSLYRLNSFKANSSGSIVKFITKGDVENIPVFIPNDTSLLHKLNKLLLLQEQSTLENELLTQLRDWLLPMLMNGQATVSD